MHKDLFEGTKFSSRFSPDAGKHQATMSQNPGMMFLMIVNDTGHSWCMSLRVFCTCRAQVGLTLTSCPFKLSLTELGVVRRPLFSFLLHGRGADSY